MEQQITLSRKELANAIGAYINKKQNRKIKNISLNFEVDRTFNYTELGKRRDKRAAVLYHNDAIGDIGLGTMTDWGEEVYSVHGHISVTAVVNEEETTK